jgi:dGTPase
VEDVRARSEYLVGMSDEVRAQHIELKRFLREKLYRHYRVRRMTLKARGVVQGLFNAFFDDISLMPDENQAAAGALIAAEGDAGRARAVADYIAGMTDRYAIREHERMFVPGESS